MSLIGTLEQFSLTTVLRRIEKHEKTGRLALKGQNSQWVEFYLHEGRLLCVNPVRANGSLGERLLQDGVVSPVVLRETLRVLGDTDASESLVARTLMDLNYVSREEMRAWAIQQVVEVLDIVLGWPAGEFDFEENVLPPNGRLLVSMSISDLLSRTSAVKPPAAKNTAQTARPAASAVSEAVATSQRANPLAAERKRVAPLAPSTPAPDVASMPTLMNASQFVDDAAFSFSSLLSPHATPAASLPTTEPFVPLLPDDQAVSGLGSVAGGLGDAAMFSTLFDDAGADAPSSSFAPLQPVTVIQPAPPRRLPDISFMQPDMILVPADLSGLRQQNPQVQITPQQWSLLTVIDGHNSLQMICQLLAVSPEVVCSVAGELIAEGLAHIVQPGSAPLQHFSPSLSEGAVAGMTPAFATPGQDSATALPWSASVPAVTPPVDAPQVFSPAPPVPTEAQWGNGENGVIFIPGQGWVMHPQSFQPPQTHTQQLPGGSYAPASMGY